MENPEAFTTAIPVAEESSAPAAAAEENAEENAEEKEESDDDMVCQLGYALYTVIEGLSRALVSSIDHDTCMKYHPGCALYVMQNNESIARLGSV